MKPCFSFPEVLRFLEDGDRPNHGLTAHLEGGCRFCEQKLKDAKYLTNLVSNLKEVDARERAFQDRERSAGSKRHDHFCSLVSKEQGASQRTHEYLSGHTREEVMRELPENEDLRHPGTVRSLCEAARAFSESDLNRAEGLLGTAEVILQKLSPPQTAGEETILAVTNADLQLGKGSLAKRRGEYQEAVGCFQEAAQGYLDAGLEDDVARVLIPWAGVLMNLEQWAEAERYYRKSLAIAETYRESLSQGQALFGLASLTMERGSLSKGLAYLEEARTIFRQKGEVALEAGTFAVEGFTYRDTGDYQHALSCFEQAEQLYESIDAMFEIARVKKNLANIYRQLGATSQGLMVVEEAIQMFREQKAEVLAMYVSLDKAELLVEIGNIPEAQAIALAACRYFRSKKIPIGIEWAETTLQKIPDQTQDRDLILRIISQMRRALEAALPSEQLSPALA